MNISVTDIRKSYERGDAVRQVLDGISLEVGPGSATAVTGPSGSGKSTLLNILGLLDAPDTGSIRFDGTEAAAMPEKERCLVRNRHIGFVFQLHHLLPQCTVMENVLLPTLADPDRERRAAAADRAHELLVRVGLLPLAHRFPATLSGGELQRTAVVRALINAPGLVLADEPTGALDADNAARLTELLLELNREQGTALVMVTHNRTLAERLDTVYELNDGKLIPV